MERVRVIFAGVSVLDHPRSDLQYQNERKIKNKSTRARLLLCVVVHMNIF